MTAPGPVSCCPSCQTAAVPHRTQWDPGGCLAHYSCTRCGKRWRVPWMLSPAEMAMYEGSAA